MKKLLLSLIACLLLCISYAQEHFINVCHTCNDVDQGFDFSSVSDSTSYFFYFDSTQTNNLWQVGIPSKQYLNSPYSWNSTKALLTDTLNTYPTNNISSFQFALVNCGLEGMPMNCWYWYWGPRIQIAHKIDSELGIDGGTIEVSHDNGNTWNNLIEEIQDLQGIFPDIYSVYDTIQSLGKPGFSGQSDWLFTEIDYSSSNALPLDTITFRFTFASDSIDTNQDGWEIGEVYVVGEYELVEELDNDIISIYPNPTADQLNIARKKTNGVPSVQILDASGRIIFSEKNYTENSINVQNLPNGNYTLRYSDSVNHTVKQFEIKR